MIDGVEEKKKRAREGVEMSDVVWRGEHDCAHYKNYCWLSHRTIRSSSAIHSLIVRMMQKWLYSSSLKRTRNVTTQMQYINQSRCHNKTVRRKQHLLHRTEGVWQMKLSIQIHTARQSIKEKGSEVNRLVWSLSKVPTYPSEFWLFNTCCAVWSKFESSSKTHYVTWVNFLLYQLEML